MYYSCYFTFFPLYVTCKLNYSYKSLAEMEDLSHSAYSANVC